jgi:hypothetical protein
MGKRILVTVDINSVSDASILYGMQLAERIKSSMVLLAISLSRSTRKCGASPMSHCDINGGRNEWLDQVLALSQQREIGLEIFFTSGRFLNEVMRFVRSQPSVRFIVMAAQLVKERLENADFAASLKRLHTEFEGEILLVEKAGEIMKVSDLYLQSSERETSL